MAGRAPRAGGGAAAGAHEAKRAAATGAEGMGGRRRPARRGGWGRRRPSGREGVAAELRAVGPRGGEELHAASVEGRGGGTVGPRGGEELHAAGVEGGAAAAGVEGRGVERPAWRGSPRGDVGRGWVASVRAKAREASPQQLLRL